MRSALHAALLCALACATPPPPPAPPPPVGPTPELEACISRCTTRRAKEASGWESVQAQCARGCEAYWDLPQCTRAAELTRLAGTRVRVQGRLHRPTALAMVLRLEDGELALTDGDALLADAPEGALLWVAGRVELAPLRLREASALAP